MVLMFLLTKNLLRIGGIFLTILLILFLVFLHFETRKVEQLISELEENISFVKVNSKESSISKSTSSPKESKIFPEKEIPAPTTTLESESRLPESQLNNKVVYLPILIYHHIDFLPANASKEWRDLTVSPQTFKKQMEYLFEQNYQPITFREFIDFLERGEKIPERSLIITFDDGWKNQYIYAFPVLKNIIFLQHFLL
jgi:hypothetical protein